MKRILIVDDDVKLCELLSEYLCAEGFSVDSVHHGFVGLEQAQSGVYDLIILDVMLPGENGFDLLRQFRSRTATPVIMLTARGDSMDCILGLELGADDYVSKPFNSRELVARIRTVLRRTKPDEVAQRVDLKRIVVGDVVIDLGMRTVCCSGKTIDLTTLEFNLLEHLLRRAGEMVHRQELAVAVLGHPLEPFDRTIDSYISKLRGKLGHSIAGADRIKSIRGVGYLYALTPTRIE